MDKKKGQQEMIGFILIVVLVVVGLVIAMIISLANQRQTPQTSLQASNILDTLLKYTTSCVELSQPRDIEGLLKGAYENKNCRQGPSMQEALQEELDNLLESILLSEATVDAITLQFYIRNEDRLIALFEGKEFVKGTCPEQSARKLASRSFSYQQEILVARITLCVQNTQI